MYCILVYDVQEKRVTKALKVCRGYLHWVQNSVFEGELTDGQFKELQSRLKKTIKPDKDSVLFYKFAHDGLFNKEIMSQERATTDNML